MSYHLSNSTSSGLEWMEELFSENKQISSFLVQNYSLSFLTSPLSVEETLSQVQYQSDDDYESVGFNNLHLRTLNEGVWRNIRTIVESEFDGTTSLLKGHVTDSVYNIAFQGLRPVLENTLNEFLDIFDDYNPSTNIISHMIVGGLLSPLELVKTRIIVESSLSTRKTYYNCIHAISSIPSEENSFFFVLFSPRLLIPALVVNAINPLVTYFSNNLFEAELDITSTYTPFLYKIASIIAIGIKVAITTPIDMARKRLMIQKINKTNNQIENTLLIKETCVQVSPVYYNGIFDCIKKVIFEEGRIKKRKRNLKNIQKETTFVYTNFSTHSSPNEGASNDTANTIRAERRRGFRQYWAGVKSLYRGFWSRYIIEVLRYLLKELDDDIMDDLKN
ncbi:hypothetical protein HK099_000912 [Clydaea vesicula]|uniref:Mitochondrial carrier n=1 Tax=Clydaea vesicula TaxID=447962 RepID=A0AAD5U3X3_9FUNG|nr:hypothetical protein HK099_000912 [Clydaea vesicula]KAJ3384663.1 hypothetical protein HDU92_003469 [Lobulomyces angularis]